MFRRVLFKKQNSSNNSFPFLKMNYKITRSTVLGLAARSAGRCVLKTIHPRYCQLKKKAKSGAGFVMLIAKAKGRKFILTSTEPKMISDLFSVAETKYTIVYTFLCYKHINTHFRCENLEKYIIFILAFHIRY